MKTTVLRKMKYKDTFIYILQFEYVFQYLFAWDDEIFRNELVSKPNFIARMLYWLRIKPLYTKQQIEEGEEIILSGAMTTIDELLKQGKGNSRADRRRKITAKAKKDGKPCQWQVRGKDIEDPYYICLTHGEAVKMEDGVEPKHS